jgi:uncharacterized membrane protein YidH (DUF202 family)
LICGVVMFAGIARFSSVPDATRARGPALIALGFIGVGLVIDLASTAAVFGQFQGDLPLNPEALLALISLEPIGQVVALIGVLTLITALLRLGQFLELPRVRDRVRTLRILLGVTLGSAILARAVLRSQAAELAVNLGLTILGLILALVTLLGYLELLGMLLKKLAAPPAPSPTTPPAVGT